MVIEVGKRHVVLGLSLVLAFAMGAGLTRSPSAPPEPVTKPGVVEASSFILRDEAGRARCTIGFMEGRAVFSLADKQGRPRIAITPDTNPRAEFYSEDGTKLLSVGLVDGKGAAIDMQSAANGHALQLSCDSAASGILITGPDRKYGMTLATFGEGESGIVLRNAKGENAWEQWSARPAVLNPARNPDMPK